jgi:hypothetical protein
LLYGQWSDGLAVAYCLTVRPSDRPPVYFCAFVMICSAMFFGTSS